jgi:hypothetical protein
MTMLAKGLGIITVKLARETIGNGPNWCQGFYTLI